MKMDPPADLPAERARPSQTRVAVFIGVIALVLGALLLAYWLMIGRPVLTGERQHDFGFVTIDGELAAVEHTFRLRNRLREPVRIENVHTSCGCMTPDLDREVIGPGEEIELRAVLELRRVGPRHAGVIVQLEGHPEVELSVRAIGRPAQRLRAVRNEVAVAADTITRVAFFGSAWADEWDDTTRAPRPTVEAPPGIRAEVTEWRLRNAGARDGRTPADWQGMIEVGVEEVAALEAETELLIRWSGAHELALPITAGPEDRTAALPNEPESRSGSVPADR